MPSGELKNKKNKKIKKRFQCMNLGVHAHTAALALL
jgi:hypothetical protein